MGVDVSLRAPAAGVDLDSVRAVVSRHDPMAWIEVDDRGVMHVETIDRYFGEGYRRGDWPLIRSLLVALRPLVPGLEYGDDHAAAFEEVTDELIARLDALWNS